MSSTTSAREGALAKLAAEAARFEHTDQRPDPPSRPRIVRAEAIPASTPAPTPVSEPSQAAVPAASPHVVDGYVPVAVAPERGNTRPVVPVDGRLHMRVASQTLADVDAVVRGWKGADPVGLRDLERATLVRIGLAMVLADVRAHGSQGAVGEAVRAALDPAVRHTDQPMPALSRWLRPTPVD